MVGVVVLVGILVERDVGGGGDVWRREEEEGGREKRRYDQHEEEEERRIRKRKGRRRDTSKGGTWEFGMETIQLTSRRGVSRWVSDERKMKLRDEEQEASETASPKT